MTTAAVISVAAGLALAIGGGSGVALVSSGGGSAPNAAYTTTTTAQPATPAPPIATETAPVPAPAPAPAPATAPAQPAPQTSSLDEATFWQLIEETRSAAGNDTGRQTELLKDRLTQLSPQAIVDFARLRAGFDRRAYTYDLWAAAYVIEDGCSDDCFRDFRGYLISLGRSAYENALQNADSLAPFVQDAEQGNWENADNVAPDAYSSVTGDDFPFDTSDLSGPPDGTAFNENDIAGLTARYPQLAARFR
jgi:uncharacterized protein DUF4240